MKKTTIITKILLGFISGTAFGYLITILISLTAGKGEYFAVVPGFSETCNNEVTAVALQFLLCGVMGSVYALSTLVWKAEYWSLLKQTIVHYFIITLVTLPIAYLTQWVEQSLFGIIKYFAIFTLSYLVIWIVLYFTIMRNIKDINRNLKK